jgi:hypothetical protein
MKGRIYPSLAGIRKNQLKTVRLLPDLKTLPVTRNGMLSRLKSRHIAAETFRHSPSLSEQRTENKSHYHHHRHHRHHDNRNRRC